MRIGVNVQRCKAVYKKKIKYMNIDYNRHLKCAKV